MSFWTKCCKTANNRMQRTALHADTERWADLKRIGDLECIEVGLVD